MSHGGRSPYDEQNLVRPENRPAQQQQQQATDDADAHDADDDLLLFLLILLLGGNPKGVNRLAM